MSIYHVGGTLPPNSPTYIYRPADDVLYQSLKEGEFCYVLNSRQMGKSSLRIKTMQRMQEEGFICLGVDITEIGSINITAEEWYAGVIDTLVNALEACNVFLLNGTFNLNDWWEQQYLLSPLQRFGKFVESLLLPLNQPLIIFLDEIDSMLPLPFKEDFFALIRTFFNNRQENAAYKNITFAIFGVAAPSDLIGDKGRTPFNIGKAVELSGFELPAALPLGKDLGTENRDVTVLLSKILEWTGGQPFLTQKICKLVSESKLTSFGNLPNLIQIHVIDNWEAQDNPSHLKTISDKIKANEQLLAELLGIYQQIILQGSIESDNSYAQLVLRLTGLVVKRKNHLVVHNRLYKAIFDKTWVENELTLLRPYAKALTEWEKSGRLDNSHLLTGKMLENAYIWAQNKNLSALDYQFLNSGSETENRQLQKQRKRLIIFTIIGIFSLIIGTLTIGTKEVAKLVSENIKEQENNSEKICEIVGPAFNGIDSHLKKDKNKIKVLVVHGGGTHIPGYTTEFSEKLARELNLSVWSEKSKNITLVDPEDNSTELGNLRINRFLNKNLSKEVLVYELTWSRIIDKQKSLLAYDTSGEYSYRRADVNQMFKHFLNDVSPGNLIYLGGVKNKIITSFVQSVCWMWSSWNDLPDNVHQACTFNSSSSIINDNYAFISQGLGGRIVLDGLQKIVAQLESFEQEELISALQTKQIHFFMMSNNLPKLQTSLNSQIINKNLFYCQENSEFYNKRIFKKTSLIVFTDPNDFLSFSLPKAFIEKYLDSRLCVDVTNININIASVIDLYGVGKFANPFTAYSGYDSDDRVVALIAKGIGHKDAAELTRQRCNWIDVID